MKKTIWLLMLVLLLPLAFAQDLCISPVKPSENCTLLSPALSCTDYFYQVFNSSGNMVANSTLSVWNSSIYNFTFSQPMGNYLVVFCNGTGLQVKELEVSWGESSMIIIATIILLPMLLSLIMLVGAATMSDTHGVLRVALFLLSIIPFFASMNFGLMSVIKFVPEFTEFQNLIGSTTYWVGIILFVLVSYFIIYAIYSIFTGMNEKKKEDLEY